MRWGHLFWAILFALGIPFMGVQIYRAAHGEYDIWLVLIAYVIMLLEFLKRASEALKDAIR